MPFFAGRARGTVEDVAAAVATAEAIAKRHDVFLQLVDPRAVYNERHLVSALLHARRARAQGRAKAHSLGAEFLLYLTGQRQVSSALERAGIKPGAEQTIVVADGDRAGTAVWGLLDKLGWSRDPNGVGTNASAPSLLGVGPSTPGPVEEAVLEKVALVDLMK